MKALLIYSPFALKGKIEKKLPVIIEKLKVKYDLTVVKTDYELHAVKLSADACGVFDVIIIAGGDGMVNEVVNGVASKPNKPILALLPVGTVNDISRSLKLPKNLNKVINIILSGNIKSFDCLKTNNFAAFYVICAGKHTQSTYKTKQRNKAKFGWFAYFYSAIKEAFNKDKHEFEISLNNEKLPDKFNFIMFINSVSVAGFRINKKAKLDDGKFDVVLFKKTSGFFPLIIRYINLIKLFLFGINSLKNNKQVIVTTVEQATIYNNLRSHFNIDGECGDAEEKVEISVLQKEIDFIVK